MRIVIVGGVAAGMSAAARARRLDESTEIIVLERGDHVSFANCGLPYYVGGEIAEEQELLLHTPESLQASLNLDVRVRHEVTNLDSEARTVTVVSDTGVEVVSYDELILTPGATAIRPPIQGLDSHRVSALRTVGDAVALRERVDSGARRAVVLGAGFIGIEAAEALRLQGLSVTIVELASHVLPPLEPEIAEQVTRELRRLGITVVTETAAKLIESGIDQDTVVLGDGTRVEADLIVLSTGVRPDTAVFEASGVACAQGAIVVDEYGRTNLPHVYAAGDAVASADHVTGARRPVALAGPANRAGRQVADFIIRGATRPPETTRPVPSAIGTAIVRVGELTAATTGANRSALDDAGISYRTLHLHPNQHAGYFPGAEPLSLVVHMGHDDGRILGAQAVGREGVDKRIDVLATAIRAGLTVPDLIDLDLAYSPVYGSAKDPVNMVGMVGENVLSGTLELWYAEQWEDLRRNSLVLDVRTHDEYLGGHFPGAINIPHTELRSRLDEVREFAGDRPVRVLCASGVRSHIANRVLTQAGLDSAALSGGMATARAVLPEATFVR